mmetsp:Transcript_83745/g.240724  ORF Transcript_83745/g.240724 Transcript_83745/m.240724 type:complete len:294 (+) Transcript_83745:78-959(+)
MLSDKRYPLLICGRRLASAGDPLLMICCALLCAVLLIASTVMRVHAGDGPGALPMAPPTDGGVSVEGRTRQVLSPASSAPQEADEVKRLKKLVIAAKKALQQEEHRLSSERKAEKDAKLVDQTKQELLEERSKLSAEEHDLNKADQALKKEKKQLDKLQSLIQKEKGETFFSWLVTNKTSSKELKHMVKDEKKILKGEAKQLAEFNRMYAKEKEDATKVERVAGTWNDIKKQFGASKNIEQKHAVEEKRRGKLRKRASKLVIKFKQLQAERSKLLEEQGDIDRRVHEASSAIG